MTREFLVEEGSPDTLRLNELPSISDEGEGDRILAEIDQDGFLFAVHEKDVPFFNRRNQKLRKHRYQVHVTIKHGVICVSKQFSRPPLSNGLNALFWGLSGLAFYTEAASLLRLSHLPCVPRLRFIDLKTRTIYMDYIRGENLRQRIASDDADIFDLDRRSKSLQLSEEDQEQQEIDLFSRRCSAPCLEEIKKMIQLINGCGVALIDIKPGNIVVGSKTGRLYWIDYEGAYLSSHPLYEQKVLEQNRQMQKWFGLDTAEQRR